MAKTKYDFYLVKLKIFRLGKKNISSFFAHSQISALYFACNAINLCYNVAVKESKMTVYEKLLSVQNKLKAPKNQYNKFGGYYYRNCEDILEAVKPILLETKTTLLLNDEVVLIGNRFYLKATAIFIDVVDGTKIECSAYANESEPHKGMTAEQVTGAASSYARKYALNALFCIDDTKDADSDEQSKQTPAQPKLPYPPTNVIAEINACKKIPDIAAVLRKYQQTYDNEQLSKVASERKQQLLAIESIPESLDSLPDFLQ